MISGVLYLASDAANMVAGLTLAIDGGMRRFLRGSGSRLPPDAKAHPL
jgi:hypothetical protein